jgi:hypothetical protein
MSKFLSKTVFGEDLGDGEYQFDIEPSSVSQFFKDMQTRVIPDYQRPYSWTAKHTETLLKDIQKSSDDNKTWFIGTVYTTKKKSKSLNGQILDGQQRLTTIQLILKEFILFNVLNEEIDLDEVSLEIKKNFNDHLDNARDCIYSQPAGGVIQRFKAESITNEILKEYILDTRGIDNRSELIDKLKSISNTLRGLASETRTAHTLERNIDCVRKFLLSLYDEGVDADSKLQNLNKFIDTLLNRFWLIEVPLKDADLSLEIFEAINNRGKPLDLLDRLQFRSLTRLPEATDISKKEWKGLYIGVENLITVGVSKAFTDHTSFYKTLFLGMSGEEQSDNDDVIEYFTRKFLGSEDDLKEFFLIAKRVISLFQAIQKPEINNGIVQKFPANDREKIVSVLQVTRRTITESKNTNQLLVNIASRNEFTEDLIYPVIIGIWNVCRLVLLKDVLFNDKSQSIRSDFNKLIKKANTDITVYARLFKLLLEFNEDDNPNGLFSVAGQLVEDNRQVNLKLGKLLEDPNKAALRTNNNNTAKLIQYYLAHFTDTNSLGNYSGNQYKNEELEHVFPRGYKANWSELTYTKEEVLNYLRELKESGNYKIDLESLIAEVEMIEDIELVPYFSAPHTTPNRLIEWHGNKHILSLVDNRKVGNKSFAEKMDIINSESSNLVIPDKSTFYGIDEEHWNYKKIIRRSLNILDFIVYEIFNRQWDEVD